MRKRNQCIKYILLFCLFSLCIFVGCQAQKEEGVEKSSQDAEKGEDIKKQWEHAKHTPYGKYPELVTYTLGKITGSNNANLPIKATYENNAYTRYLREQLNIQNEDVLEGENSDSYQEAVQILMEDKQLPDLLVVKGRETVKELVERGMVEDLTTVYEECTTDRIKEMYQSYGDALLESATFDGKLYAFPDTEVDQGASLLWLRKDWMAQLGLPDPETLEEGMEIVRQFVQEDMAGDQKTIGLAASTDLVSENSGTYGLDAIFAQYHAKPSQWILDGQKKVVYGSVTEETKQALIYLHQLYEEGILDPNFLLRKQENLDALLKEGACGAIFGYWWAPNNPLSLSYSTDRTAQWQPYLLTGDASARIPTFQSYEDCLYVVVRKGYEHPEIVGKYVSTLFDRGRFEDQTQADEINEYFSLNVDPTARPLNINVDYWDAIYRVQKNMQAVLDGGKKPEELNGLEGAYYKICRSFLTGDVTTSNAWAAYASRIQATGLLTEAHLDQNQPPLSLGGQEIKIPEELLEEEKNTFLQIIVGEKPPEYFDTFVQKWYENGGNVLTQQAESFYKEINR